jgi:hypothetical protein
MPIRFSTRALPVLLWAMLGVGRLCAQANAPTLTDINPPRAASPGTNLSVTFTGTNLNYGPFKFITDRPGQLDFQNWDQTSTTITATVVVLSDAFGTVQIAINTPNGTSASLPFYTGAIAGGSSGSCTDKNGQSTCSQIHWEVDTNAATTSSQQSNARTAPDVLFKLDYQIRTAQAKTLDQARETGAKCNSPIGAFCADATKSFVQTMTAHLIFKTGLSQVAVSDKVQPLAAGSTTPAPSTTPCPGTPAATTSTTTKVTTPPPDGCPALTTHQAYIVEAGGTFGWELGRNGEGTFTEAGIKARGSFQALLPSDQIVQSQGNFYSDLTSVNLRNAIGLYEFTGRFRVAQRNHDEGSINSITGKYQKNPDDLLVIEAGYQNNSGLQHLITTSPLTNTRNRFVGRFYAYPEINAASHTRVLFGVEYNSGINGGPRDIRLFYGASLDPAALIKLANR